MIGKSEYTLDMCPMKVLNGMNLGFKDWARERAASEFIRISNDIQMAIGQIFFHIKYWKEYHDEKLDLEYLKKNPELYAGVTTCKWIVEFFGLSREEVEAAAKAEKERVERGF